MAENVILVVDDEEPIRQLLDQFFTELNYTVHTAESGEEALEILKKEPVHLMFLDLKLPGMSGIELCRKIKKDRPADICIAITGFTSIFELTECREAGFDDYFTKPVGLEKLKKTVEESFDKLDRWRRK